MADLPLVDWRLVKCPVHPNTPLRCPACIGAKGGRVKSARKTKAVRKNAKRPRPRSE